MRLLSLLESDTQVWYHGSPEGQNIKGAFEQRMMGVEYLTDYKAWIALQDQMNSVENGSDEYMDLIHKAGDLRAHKQIPSPIFFSDNYSVANTYADDNRAWDYQNAEPKVFKAIIDAGNVLTVNAFGESFRGISLRATKQALQKVGIDEARIEAAIGQFTHSIRGDGSKLSTDSLAMIAHELGFDTIDVKGVKDTYMGGGPNATVRMVFDPSRINLQG